MDKLEYERKWQERGYALIAGVDEVGRGPLAGPVVTAAVIMPLDDLIEGVDDSKKLSPKKREKLAEEIQKKAIAYCISEVSHTVIDEINILQATRLCMKQSVEGLKIAPSCVLTDGNMMLDIAFEQESIVKGDAKSYSVGCASILAKVYRDNLMKEMAKAYPYYGFEKNAGYGTALHIQGIREHGLCEIHRKTFVKKFSGETEKNEPSTF
ncbi:MAG: ribonuclease HII [Clostridia bacterium]|nr:ribonuclease HII [Clostridia bacterium]